MLGMGKKKPPGGKHTTPRHAVQIPEDWYAVAQAAARRKGQPTAWWIVAAVRGQAEREGAESLPELPWLTDPPPAPKKRKGK